MNDSIVGVLAAATRDHLLIDVPLHIALCGKNPKGKIICEIDTNRPLSSMDEVFNVWHQSTRQCSWCVKKLEKRNRKDS